jgi:hypothetical protein
MVLIMRYPCLMEDEGRHFFVEGPIPREDAKRWIANQKDQYFKPSDYYIVDANKSNE